MSSLIATDQAHWARPLVLATYIASLAVFIWDVSSTDILAFGVLYMPLVATALTCRDRRAEWLLATIACAMVIIGTFIPSIDPHTVDLLVNRATSIAAVWGTAVLVRYVRLTQDKLSTLTNLRDPTEATDIY